MMEPKKRIKRTCSAVNPEAAKPLVYAELDVDQPSGRAKGQITTDPLEVDGVASRAWQRVYQGNASDLRAAADNFANKYKKFIFKGPVYNVARVSADDVAEEMKRAKKR